MIETLEGRYENIMKSRSRGTLRPLQSLMAFIQSCRTTYLRSLMPTRGTMGKTAPCTSWVVCVRQIHANATLNHRANPDNNRGKRWQPPCSIENRRLTWRVGENPSCHVKNGASMGKKGAFSLLCQNRDIDVTRNISPPCHVSFGTIGRGFPPETPLYRAIVPTTILI